MKKLSVLCFFVFLIPALGCIGSANIEHALLANLSEVTVNADEEALGAVVFTLLEATAAAQIDTTIEEDGTGTIRYGFAYNPTILEEAAEGLPSGFLDSINCSTATKLLLEEAPDGSSLVEERSGSQVWCLVEVPFANVLQLANIYKVILSPLNADGERMIDASTQKPLVDVRCLELVDGKLYHDLVVDQSAINPEDKDLLNIFGIDVQWRLSTAGTLHHHNGLSQQTSLLSWNPLDSLERLSVNIMPEDACPSSRVKLLLEFTTTNTTLATLTIPISRSADDYLQNEAVRQRLAQQGWVTQIEGSANHAPQIVALQQFDRDELDLLISTIPGVDAISKAADSETAQIRSSAVSDVEELSDFELEIELDSFANTWALLMPTHAPTAFELAVQSMGPVSTSTGEQIDPALPILLWNGSSDDMMQPLAFTLGAGNANLIVNGDSPAEATPGERTIAQVQTDPSSTRVVGVLGPQNPNNAVNIETVTPSATATAKSTSTRQPTSTQEPTATSKPTETSRPTETAQPTETSKPTETPAPTETPRPTATPSPQPTATAFAGAILDDEEQTASETNDTEDSGNRVALRPSTSARTDEAGSSDAAIENDVKDEAILAAPEDINVQTIGDLIETEPTAAAEEAGISASTELSATQALEEPTALANDSALALKVADILESRSDDAESTESSAVGQAEATTIDSSDVDSSLPTCQVVIEWLNLRPGPGFEYGEPIAALPQSTDLLVVGQGPWGAWIEVIAAETLERGWVSLSPEFVLCEDDLTDVTEVDFATLPLPTAPSPVAAPTNAPADEDAPAAERGTSEVKALPAGN